MEKSIDYSLAVVYRRAIDLNPNPKNPRTHSKTQIRQIADSIQNFGFTNPILIDRDNSIIAGHGRVEAAKLLCRDSVPTIQLESLTPEQVRAYIIADNRLAENGGWDKEILAIELQHLLTIEDFDVRLTGFEVPEIDLILQEVARQEEPDEILEIEAGPAVTRSGDLWQLGKHRILCGTSLLDVNFSALLGKRRADIVFTDPPYNVPIEGNVCGKGTVHHREFAMASGEMDEVQFLSFLSTTFQLLNRFSTSGSVHFICMDWRHMPELLDAGHRFYEELLNVCVWVKDNGGMGSFYRSRHELIFVFRNGKDRHRNNVQLGRYGRNRTNVWEYPSVNTASRTGEEGNLLALHPTVKPLAMVADALLDCSARGDIVLDGFLGSGTTLLAAERVSRTCYGIEIDPLYVDIAIRRWQRLTGEHAIHVKRDKRFDDLTEAEDPLHG